MTDERLAVELRGLKFTTPLMLLSGCDGFGQEHERVVGADTSLIGAVFLKGTTVEPRLGNPAHRLWETPSGLLNAIGLQNPGVDVVIRDLLPRLDTRTTHYIANISGATLEEYRELARRFDETVVSAIEINVSCPNVKAGGMQFGNDPDMCARVIEACRSVTGKPLITKLTPAYHDTALLAQKCIDAGTDALSLINTVSGMAFDIRKRQPALGFGQGGLSGPAIKPIALLKVHQAARICRPRGIPIIGQGGITCSEDAIEFFLAGADAIGIGTALFYDPLIYKRIHEDLLDYLAQHQLNRITDIKPWSKQK